MTTRHDEIKDYLTNQLSPTLRQEFETELRTDPALRAEVEFLRQAFDTLELAVQDDLREKIQHWRKPQNHPTRLYSWRWSAAAAVLILIGCALWFFWPADRYMKFKELYVYLAPGNLRGDAPMTKEQAEIKLSLLFEASKNLFNQRDFRASLLKLDEITSLLSIYELNDKQSKSDMVDWFKLLNYYNLDPKSVEFRQLKERIAGNHNHAYHQKLKQL